MGGSVYMAVFSAERSAQPVAKRFAE
jgi:hypothetical protein